MSAPSQRVAVTGGAPGPWAILLGYRKAAAWVALGWTDAVDLQFVGSDDTPLAGWSVTATDKPDTYYIPADVRLEARRPAAGDAIVIVQEGVTWPGT